jgi:hypothetical protein
VTIDSLIRDFLEPTNEAHWESVPGEVGEYVWTSPFLAAGDDKESNTVTRGAFLDRHPYTRLITCSQLEDLRAQNQVFNKDAVEGNRVCVKNEDGRFVITDEFRPPMYMGPGIWFDLGKDDSVGGPPPTRKVHIRLSHTTNHVPALDDYTEPPTRDSCAWRCRCARNMRSSSPAARIYGSRT